MAISDQVFLFSKAQKNPEHFFQGYCFHGANYIFSESGARDYRLATGTIIRGGEDGCYVSAIKDRDTFKFSTDFSGNKKVFYYWGKAFWAVSNSIPVLVAHLKENGITPPLNVPQLRAMAIKRSSAFNQLYSYQTIACGIFLVPLGATLTIGDHGVSLELTRLASQTDYRSSLSHFVETWVSRFETLFSSTDVHINMDLTGGLDSRTVFSIVRKAMERMGRPEGRLRINSGIAAGDDTDLRIATQICKQFDMPINGPWVRNPTRHSPESSYESWRNLCLGAYHPIYFPAASPCRDRISIGGGGGENHRPFYKLDSAAAFVQSLAKKMPGEHLRPHFSDDISGALSWLSNNSSVDPLMLHYRHFRNRFHTGRSSQYSVTFSPLASGLLEIASNSAGAEKLKSAQVIYDVIASTTPDLLEVPFDKPTKAPTEIVRSQLTRVEINSECAPGAIYGNGAIPQRGQASKATQLELLMSEFFMATKHSFVVDFWGTEFIRQVEITLSEAVERGRFSHAIDGQPVAAVLATNLLMPNDCKCPVIAY